VIAVLCRDVGVPSPEAHEATGDRDAEVARTRPPDVAIDDDVAEDPIDVRLFDVATPVRRRVVGELAADPELDRERARADVARGRGIGTGEVVVDRDANSILLVVSCAEEPQGVGRALRVEGGARTRRSPRS
jgi:hypothetical protein